MSGFAEFMSSFANELKEKNRFGIIILRGKEKVGNCGGRMFIV